MKTGGQYFDLNLGGIVHHTTRFLLMKAHLTAVHLFGTVLGHYVEIKRRGNVSLFEVAGAVPLILVFILLTGSRYSLLPALSTKGMVFARIVEGSFTTRRFLSFLEGLLDRMDLEMQPGAHIVMDNAHIHHHDSIRDLIEGRGYKIIYLPPYSPDYNPIELAFSAIKAYVRRAGTLGRDEDEDDDTYAYVHLLEAAFSVSEESAEGWFHHCGYI